MYQQITAIWCHDVIHSGKNVRKRLYGFIVDNRTALSIHLHISLLDSDVHLLVTSMTLIIGSCSLNNIISCYVLKWDRWCYFSNSLSPRVALHDSRFKILLFSFTSVLGAAPQFIHYLKEVLVPFLACLQAADCCKQKVWTAGFLCSLTSYKPTSRKNKDWAFRALCSLSCRLKGIKCKYPDLIIGNCLNHCIVIIESVYRINKDGHNVCSNNVFRHLNTNSSYTCNSTLHLPIMDDVW